MLQHRTLVTSLVAAYPSGAYYYPTNAGWFAYAPWDQSYYVAAPPSSVDQVLAGNLSLNAVIPVGSDPFAVAVDPSLKTVWVTNSGSGNVSVINGTTQHPLGSVQVQSKPEGIAFDATNGTFYVADNSTSNVTVIRSNLNGGVVIQTVRVGTGPVGVAWDNRTNHIFASDNGLGHQGETDQVTVIAGGTNRVLANVSVGSRPVGIAVDNISDRVYVANEGSNNLSVISPKTNAVVATVPIAVNGWKLDLENVAFDSLHNVIWVAAGFSAIVVNTTTERAEAEVYYDPAGIVFNPDNGNVCVTNNANRSFGCFQFSSTFSDKNITFSETGLPAGKTWSVQLDEGRGGIVNNSVTQYGNGSTIVFGVDMDPFLTCTGGNHTYSWCYNYSYSVSAVSGYPVVPASGFVRSLSQTDSTVYLTFGRSYSANFSETGLSNSSQWGVTVSNATRSWSASGYAPSNVSLSLPNGTYRYSASAPLGWSSTVAMGNFTISGSGNSRAIHWTFAGYYSIAFLEAGLPSGTNWSVVLARQGSGATASTITFFEANGSYVYYVPVVHGYVASPDNGTVTVSGASIAVAITFNVTSGNYLVAFNETGLPNGTQWDVTLGGSRISGTATSLQLVEPNGNYTYSVGTVRGFSASPHAGTVNVQGAAPPVVTIRFTSNSLYNLTFREKGLPNGTGWAVSIGNQLVSSVTAQIILVEPNGTYGYVVLPVSGYVTASSGFVTMHGNATVNITFRPESFPVVVLELGLPSGTTWSVTVYNRSTGFNETFTTNSTALVFYLPNGTYAIAVSAKGYNVTLSTPTITVAGELLGASPTAVFSSPSGRSSPPAWYQLSTEEWFLVGLGTAVIILGGVTLLFRTRRGRRTEGERWVQELSPGGELPADAHGSTAPESQGSPEDTPGTR